VLHDHVHKPRRAAKHLAAHVLEQRLDVLRIDIRVVALLFWFWWLVVCALGVSRVGAHMHPSPQHQATA